MHRFVSSPPRIGAQATLVIMLRLLCLLLAATSVEALTATPSVRCPQLHGAARAAVLASDSAKPDERPPRVMPPERPREMMTESERRRTEPVHDIKKKRKIPKIRDEEGNVIDTP